MPALTGDLASLPKVAGTAGLTEEPRPSCGHLPAACLPSLPPGSRLQCDRPHVCSVGHTVPRAAHRRLSKYLPGDWKNPVLSGPKIGFPMKHGTVAATGPGRSSLRAEPRLLPFFSSPVVSDSLRPLGLQHTPFTTSQSLPPQTHVH